MEVPPKAEAAPAADPWPGYFADRGHPEALRIGAGVEGVVYRLGGGCVAKVWTGRPPTELTRQVYADIARHPLPFATPEIFAVQERGGVVVTYERELPASRCAATPRTRTTGASCPSATGTRYLPSCVVSPRCRAQTRCAG